MEQQKPDALDKEEENRKRFFSKMVELGKKLLEEEKQKDKK
ncbi:MAG TPA: hypothetical protein VMX17_08915 [Candidatus Glassbacteria bacterium]|nr:hypothetical protein [Candidatus Glassbacteria bacterium]